MKIPTRDDILTAYVAIVFVIAILFGAITLILFLFLGGEAAEAGWFSDFCQRHLIADDPYQFETATEINLRREHYRYFAKIRNGLASKRDRQIFELIESELKRRGEP